MSQHVILCDSHYQPLREICVEHAVYLLVSGKAAPAVDISAQAPVARLGLAASAVANWGARFPHLIVDGAFLVPAVLRLHRPVAYRLAHRRPSRALVLRRDRNRCQYCGVNGATTIDHVMPQSRGGKDTWENLVAACARCNHGKADRTPEEAGMRLMSKGRRLAPDLYSEVLTRMIRAVGG